MARFGLTANLFPTKSLRSKAAIPEGLHLSEEIISSRPLRNFFTSFLVERYLS
jgi:hypothetical protein